MDEQQRKHLFNNDEWTKEGHTLGDEIDTALRPIIQKWANQGYSLREIYYVILALGSEAHLSEIVLRKTSKEITK